LDTSKTTNAHDRPQQPSLTDITTAKTDENPESMGSRYATVQQLAQEFSRNSLDDLDRTPIFGGRKLDFAVNLSSAKFQRSRLGHSRC